MKKARYIEGEGKRLFFGTTYLPFQNVGKSQFCRLSESENLPPTHFLMIQKISRQALSPKKLAATYYMPRQINIHSIIILKFKVFNLLCMCQAHF